MLTRLADIIQMEATYHAKQDASDYNFDLDKSYTYVRVSGAFETDFFKQIGESNSAQSDVRVIYNGY